jgi:hypothetical protein
MCVLTAHIVICSCRKFEKHCLRGSLQVCYTSSVLSTPDWNLTISTAFHTWLNLIFILHVIPVLTFQKQNINVLRFLPLAGLWFCTVVHLVHWKEMKHLIDTVDSG